MADTAVGSSAVVQVSSPAATTPAVGLTAVDAKWVGSFEGHGAASPVKVALPGNQGVQLAWVQDKGATFVGAVFLSLTITSDGKVDGEVTGALGKLLVASNWDGSGTLHAQLSATNQTPEAFNGTLTVPPTDHAPFASATLRVVSNDGKWLRQASFSLRPTRQ